MIISGKSEHLDKNIQVTTLRNATGLYFESISPLRTSNTNWDFVTYVNLTTYDLKFRTLQNYFQSTSDICVLLKVQEDETLNDACITFMQTTYPFVHEIELNFNSIMKVLAPGRKSPEHLTRRTRGLINAVGRLTNILFGVCSDEDAEFFYTNIQNLRDSNEKSLHLAHEQLRIVSSVVQDVNFTVHDLTTDYQKTRSTIDRLSEQAKRMLNAIDILSVKTKFDEHTTILGLLLNQFAWETQNLQTIVNFALNGLMHTSVYPPSELYHELKEIQLTLPPTLELPAMESHLALPELFRASTLSVVYSQQTLMFIARIPLLSNIPFNIYHTIPLPITVAPGKIVLIKPDTQYLAVSSNSEFHFSLTESQYMNCKTLFSYKLCLGLEFIFKRVKTDNCEVSLYNNPEKLSDICNLRYLSMNTAIWHKLRNQNSWLYYVTHQVVTVACRKDSYKLVLTGVGKLDIPEYCVVYTDYSILTPTRNLRTQVHKDFIPESPSLNYSISLKKIIEYHEPQKIDNHMSYTNFNKLAQDAQDLNQLEELYKDTTKNIFVKPEHHIILLYVIVIILVIISLYLIIKYRCNIPKLYSPDIAEPHIKKDIVQSRTALACSLSEETT